MLVGYLGPKGSFSHQVALKAFPEAHLEPYPNITEVIKAYERGQVDLSIVPVENSIEGSVHETLDYLFHQAQIQAVAELIQPIKQQLGSLCRPPLADRQIVRAYLPYGFVSSLFR